MVGKNMKNNKVETGKNEETTDKRIEETTDKRIEERLTNEDDICKNGKQVKVENVSVQIVKGKIENGLLDNSGCFLCGIKAGEEKHRTVFDFIQKFFFSYKMMSNCFKTLSCKFVTV